MREAIGLPAAAIPRRFLGRHTIVGREGDQARWREQHREMQGGAPVKTMMADTASEKRSPARPRIGELRAKLSVTLHEERAIARSLSKHAARYLSDVVGVAAGLVRVMAQLYAVRSVEEPWLGHRGRYVCFSFSFAYALHAVSIAARNCSAIAAKPTSASS